MPATSPPATTRSKSRFTSAGAGATPTPFARRAAGNAVSVVKQIASARPSKPVASWSETVFTPVFSVTESASCHIHLPSPSAPSARGAVSPLTMRWKRPAPGAFGLHFAVQFLVCT